MKMTEVMNFGLDLMEAHGLIGNGWTLNISNDIRYIGCCKHQEKEITLSDHYFETLPIPELRDVLRHEIAHALVGFGHGHNSVWKRKIMELGGTPRATRRISFENQPGWAPSFNYKGRTISRGDTLTYFWGREVVTGTFLGFNSRKKYKVAMSSPNPKYEFRRIMVREIIFDI